MMSKSRFPSMYIPHGGGPCFFIRPEDNPPGMPPDLWKPMETYLRGIDASIGRRPRAVVVITAHWMTPRPMIGNAARHHLLYDYYNFPEYTYHFDYAPRGAPDVADRVAELLGKAFIASDMDGERGIDHGVFIPFMLIYPDGDVPIVPLSLQQNPDAAEHLAIGKALEPLRDEDVLIVGSGMSFHNLRGLLSGSATGASVAFDDWLTTVAQSEPEKRGDALADWMAAPGARGSHPLGGEEHLIPLMVASGAAGSDRGRKTYGGTLGGNALSGFTFG